MPCKTIIKKATSSETLRHWFNNISNYANKFKIIKIIRLKDKKKEGLFNYKLTYKPKKETKRHSKSDAKGNALGISWYSKKKDSGWEL